MAAQLEEPLPLDPVLVRQRWYNPHRIAWAKTWHARLTEIGGATSEKTYDTAGKARYAARRLRETMIALDLVESWQVKEHIERIPGGWSMSLEYIPRHKELPS